MQSQQSSQVDLLTKGEIFDGRGFVSVTAGEYFVGGLGHAPQTEVAKVLRVFLHSKQKCDAIKATV